MDASHPCARPGAQACISLVERERLRGMDRDLQLGRVRGIVYGSLGQTRTLRAHSRRLYLCLINSDVLLYQIEVILVDE